MCIRDSHNIDLFVIPDFTTLVPAQQILQSSSPSSSSPDTAAANTVQLGAQDTFHAARGPYTGEVSPLNLSQIGVRIVEIGHAERRRLFHETDAEVAQKAAAVQQHGMVPLVCVGEKALPPKIASAAVGAALNEIEPQVKAVMAAVSDDADVILAYEPVWAIGAAEPADADHVVGVTRALWHMLAGRKGRTRILYGGSAGPGTFAKLKDGVDGLFLGRFAHDVKNLEKVIMEMSEP